MRGYKNWCNFGEKHLPRCEYPGECLWAMPRRYVSCQVCNSSPYGPMLCDFPDLYDYGLDGIKSSGIGVYCLMCAGGNADQLNPTHVCAYLKYRSGWAESVTRITPGLTATATAGNNTFFLHGKNPVEYFIIENRFKAGRDQALTDSGLAIWHVDELGNNSNEHMTPGVPLRVLAGPGRR
jgi:hypothetical protein